MGSVGPKIWRQKICSNFKVWFCKEYNSLYFKEHRKIVEMVRLECLLVHPLTPPWSKLIVSSALLELMRHFISLMAVSFHLPPAKFFFAVKLWFGCGKSTMSTTINNCNFLPVERELHPSFLSRIVYCRCSTWYLHADPAPQALSGALGEVESPTWACLVISQYFFLVFFFFFASTAQFAAAGWSKLSWPLKTWVASIPTETVIKLNWKCDLWCLWW